MIDGGPLNLLLAILVWFVASLTTTTLVLLTAQFLWNIIGPVDPGTRLWHLKRVLRR